MVGQHAFIAVYILASRRNGTLYTRPPTDVSNVRDGWKAALAVKALPGESGRMSPLRMVVVVRGVLVLAGCTVGTGGLSVHKAGLSTIRPEGTIGPNEDDPPWQTYTVELPARLAQTVTGADSSFHLVVTDCRYKDAGRVQGGRFDLKWVSAEDVYVDGITLNASSGRQPNLKGRKGPIVRGVAYVSTSRIRNIRELCFQASGGSMIGLGFKTNTVRVRS